MRNRRLLLSGTLHEVLGSDNVYYQPPETVKMRYPAIVYALDGIENVHADDEVYLRRFRYSVTVIDKSPDSTIADKVALLPKCHFNRSYAKDNLNHYVFTLYI